MDAKITVESLPLLGVCNLCLNECAVKSMLFAHNVADNNESYKEMLLKCFAINMSLLDLCDTKQLICKVCVGKLLDSVRFREQVEASLKTLVATVKLNKTEHCPLVKREASLEVEELDLGAFDDDEDNIMLNDLIIVKKEPYEERRKNKIRSKKKLLKYTVTKHDFKDTEIMLESGLFPFKIKKDRTFSCAICPEKSENLDDIQSHIIEHNKGNIHVAFKKMLFSKSQRFYKSYTKLRCKICTTDISDYAELKNHIAHCTRLKNCSWNHLPFKLEKDQLDCPVCKKTFLNFVRLNTHMNVHYPNFICESCGKAFASKARLRGHMRTHEVGSFSCKYCDAVFDRVTKRENHVSKEHKAGVRYACKRCNISLSSFYARQKHLAEVHNEELKRYKCKACPQSYITPGHLSSHVRRDHLNERNHKCDKCDLAFYTKNALKMHMIKHDGERIHSCPICQKSYQRKKTLREHMRIHNNDKRFICPVCGRAFTQKCTLKGHLKVHDRKIDIDDPIMQPLDSV